MYVLILLIACAAVFAIVKRRQRERNKPVIAESVSVRTERVIPKETPPPSRPFAAAADYSAAAGGQRAVLIADDQPMIRTLLRELFQQDGIAVYEASNGLEAVETVRKHSIDFVLMDLNMPGMNGIHALKEIRLLNETVGVAFITGFGASDQLAEAEALGVTAFFTKPFDIDTVKDHVINSWKAGIYREEVVVS